MPDKQPPDPIDWHPNKERVEIMGSIVLDTLFFGIWAVTIWGFDWLLKWLNLDDSLDKRVLDIFLKIFAITTVIPIARFLLIDISIVLVRTFADLKAIWKRDDSLNQQTLVSSRRSRRK